MKCAPSTWCSKTLTYLLCKRVTFCPDYLDQETGLLCMHSTAPLAKHRSAMLR